MQKMDFLDSRSERGRPVFLASANLERKQRVGIGYSSGEVSFVRDARKARCERARGMKVKRRDFGIALRVVIRDEKEAQGKRTAGDLQNGENKVCERSRCREGGGEFTCPLPSAGQSAGRTEGRTLAEGIP